MLPRRAVACDTCAHHNCHFVWSPEHVTEAPLPFVHLDVQSAYSVGGTSPSLPDDYVRTLARQHPLGPNSANQPRPALALADYGLQSAVKTAVACARAG